MLVSFVSLSVLHVLGIACSVFEFAYDFASFYRFKSILCFMNHPFPVWNTISQMKNISDSMQKMERGPS